MDRVAFWRLLKSHDAKYMLIRTFFTTIVANMPTLSHAVLYIHLQYTIEIDCDSVGPHDVAENKFFGVSSGIARPGNVRLVSPVGEVKLPAKSHSHDMTRNNHISYGLYSEQYTR